MFSIVVFFLFVMVNGVYIPGNGDDWTLLKPEVVSNGVQTVPFNFGIVVTMAESDCDEDHSGRSLDSKLLNIDTFQHDDGQVQRRPQFDEESKVEMVDDHEFSIKAVSCMTDSALLMSLTGGIIRDSSNRIGTIVENRQFQFDGPTPQHGTIYANGWSISHDGNLMLGNQNTFYQCASGDFYNLYDQSIDKECDPVRLTVVGLIDC